MDNVFHLPTKPGRAAAVPPAHEPESFEDKDGQVWAKVSTEDLARLQHVAQPDPCITSVLEVEDRDGTRTAIVTERTTAQQRTLARELLLLPVRLLSYFAEWVLMLVSMTLGRLAGLLGALSLAAGVVMWIWWPEQHAHWKLVAGGLVGFLVMLVSHGAFEAVERFNRARFRQYGQRSHYYTKTY